MSQRIAVTSRTQTNSPALVPSILFFLGVALILIAVPVSSHAIGNADVAGSPHGDAGRGKQLFDKRCGGCHAMDEDREGPRLRNVYGRKAGVISTFKYSESLKSAQVIWNEATLNKWLLDTDSLVPDNDMEFHVPKADERADIIQYLRVSSGK